MTGHHHPGRGQPREAEGKHLPDQSRLLGDKLVPQPTPNRAARAGFTMRSCGTRGDTSGTQAGLRKGPQILAECNCC
jgi:hypothetical protein